MAIKVTKLSEPTHKIVKVQCPGCGASINREVLIKTRERKEQCSLCLTTFKWEEVE